MTQFKNMTAENKTCILLIILAMILLVTLVYWYIEEEYQLKLIDAIDRSKYYVNVFWDGEHDFTAYATNKKSLDHYVIVFKHWKMSMQYITTYKEKDKIWLKKHGIDLFAN